MYLKNIFFYFLASLTITSCLHRELENLPSQDSIENPAKGFNFKTTEEFSFSVLTLTPDNNAIAKAIIEVYPTNPYRENSTLNSEIEQSRLFKGITNSKGKVDILFPIPSHLDSLYIITKHIGLPNITAISLNKLYNQVVIQNKPAHSSSKSASNFNNALDYLTLGNWNSFGVPNYLESVRDNISASLLEDINATLPESIPLPVSHPQYLTNSTEANLIIEEECEVWVTFIHEGAGWLNVLGYYTYPTNNTPETREDIANETVIFPNVSYAYSGGGLYSGDKVQLKYYNAINDEFEDNFPAGVSIGWFIIGNGWKNRSVTEGNYKHYSDNSLNIEEDDNLKKHSVLLHDKERDLFLLGFEDIRRDSRSCDNDFNDAVFCATVSPTTAVNRLRYEPVDSPEDNDEDGVTNVFDDYPDNKDLAFNNYYPSPNNFGTLVFEDLWPYKGDYDFNDLVVDYQYNQKTNSDNKVQDIELDLVLRAIGATYRNGFGIELITHPSNINQVNGALYTENIIVNNNNGTEANQDNAVVILFDNAYSVLQYPGTGVFINTSHDYPKVMPDTLNISISLINSVALGEVGLPPFNPFIFVNQQREVEVHLPGNSPTNMVNTELFGQGHDDSNPQTGAFYMSDEYLPWAINFPESFTYPSEKNDITNAYNVFNAWANSQGFTYME